MELTGGSTGVLRVGIGIDTGGTFTDAVAVDLDSGGLLAKAKSPTTREDLAVGVGVALRAIDPHLFASVELVSLSTTLATNAVVEGKGGRVGLIIAVPDPSTFAEPPGLPAEKVAVIAGAHQPDGRVRTPLDVAAAAEAVESMAESVDAFAVSAYFGVSNDEHENAIKALIEGRCEAPVVCGHELSQRIGMVERASTAAINARLLPLVRGLLDAVTATLSALGIDAPLVVVKGDGSFTAEEVARSRPVETVLSGPAASVVGACTLSGLTSALVADMGGTTTDIALVNGGMPEVNAEGALVGGWRTRVQALDVTTVGLGGDSRVRAETDGRVSLGPDRAIPLAIASRSEPGIRETMVRNAQGLREGEDAEEPLFLTLIHRPAQPHSEAMAALLDLLDGRFVHVSEALAVAGPFVDIDALVRSGVVAESACTPTDLLHAEGLLGDAESRLVANTAIELLAAASHRAPAELSAAVRSEVSLRLAVEVASRALSDDLGGHAPQPAEKAVLEHLMQAGDRGSLRAELSLGLPLVAVGAPVQAWFPHAAAFLGCELVIPEHAEVANAYGALAGRVLERAEARVRAEPDETYLVVTSAERRTFGDLGSAKRCAEELASAGALDAAVVAGAVDASVTLGYDEVVAQQDSGDDVFVELTVVATASSAPRLTRRGRPEETG